MGVPIIRIIVFGSMLGSPYFGKLPNQRGSNWDVEQRGSNWDVEGLLVLQTWGSGMCLQKILLNCLNKGDLASGSLGLVGNEFVT